tara:strand:- start:1291 stop:2565 length:1275 start_codon:yes stop_codon:yes gene_type:complete
MSYFNQNRKNILIVIIFGIFASVFMLWFVDYKISGDAINYLDSAKNISKHQVFSDDYSNNPQPSFYRPPLYSFYISIFLQIFNSSTIAIQSSQLLLHFISAFLLAQIALKINEKSALIVFLLAVICPYNIMYTIAILSETLSSFFLICIFYFLVVIESRWKFVFCGIFLGLLTLTKDIYSLLVVFISIHILIFGKEKYLAKSFNFLLIMFTFLLIVTPWTLRNYSLTDRFILVSEGRLGYSLWTGTWATNPPIINTDKGDTFPEFPSNAFRSETEKINVMLALKEGINNHDSFFKHLAIDRIKKEPIFVLKNYLLRAPRLWLGTRFDIFVLNKKIFPYGGNLWTVAKIILYAINFLLIILSILGMFYLFKKKSNYLTILLIPIVYTAAVYVPLNSFENRYSQPVYLFIIFFAAQYFSRFVKNKY